MKFPCNLLIVCHQFEEKNKLLACIGASVLTWNLFLQLRKYILSRSKEDFVPVGTVKEIYIYPIKCCAPKKVFSAECGWHGLMLNEYRDRNFLIIDGKTGKLYEGRLKMQMVLIEPFIENGVVTLKHPQHEDVSFKVDDVVKARDARIATIFKGLRTGGIDCGDVVSKFLSDVLEEEDVRLIMYTRDSFNERVSVTQDWWWSNNPVPKRQDTVAFANLTPFLITTQSSLDDLNKRVAKPLTNIHFRGVIVVEHCPAWDEDKWLNVRIGDAEMQCFRPCSRCMSTTVDPVLGTREPDGQPLKALREFRLAPEGSTLRKMIKDSPIFGVNAGLVKKGYIHVGQTVWATYKPSVW